MTFKKGNTIWRGRQHSKETIQKLSEMNKGEKNPNYGKVASNETRQKMSISQKELCTKEERRRRSERNKGEGNPFFGRKHSEESKRKMSEVKQGKNHPLYGKHHTEETKQQISKSHTGFHHSEETKQKLREARLTQKIIFKDTSIETLMQGKLKERGVSFRTHVPLLKKYQVDVLIGDKLIVECDGDYWHNLPDKIKSDRIRDQELSEAGYEVHRFWEHEINSNVEGCVDQIIGSMEVD